MCLNRPGTRYPQEFSRGRGRFLSQLAGEIGLSLSSDVAHLVRAAIARTAAARGQKAFIDWVTISSAADTRTAWRLTWW